MTTLSRSPLYQAPEVLRPPYTKAVDIWSLGIIIAKYQYKWYALSLSKLTKTPADSWLMDTAGTGVPGIRSFWESKLKRLP